MTMPVLSSEYNSQWSGRSSNIEFTARDHLAPHMRDSISPSTRLSMSNGYSSDQHSDTEEGPVYLLEHLATFSVGRNNTDPADGLNRLWQMERRSGIWTQKMQLRLTKKWVIILDFENGDVVERFPMQLITSPVAYAGTDPKELYNNILTFIVKDEPKSKNHSHSEMHIFQAVHISAQEIVDEMKLFMEGRWKSPFKSAKLPPPPSSPAPEPPMNGMHAKQMTRYSSRSSNIDLERRGSPGLSNRDYADETSSTSSERYEIDVGILNHCFDDIEQFIAWLQSAASAYRELERRRNERKNKRKDHGDGLLAMRARPPPERDFVDVFQKFKLSFNLLAKLKAHIHDPNAPELVHFLFTPLALIVDASRDSHYGPNLAAKVVSPLLTKEAVELLGNCLTSKESDLWHSLGEAWIVPKGLYKMYVAPYQPVFRDGYSPEYPFGDEREHLETQSVSAITVKPKVPPPELEMVKNGQSTYSSNFGLDQVDLASSPENSRHPLDRRGLNRAQSPNSERGLGDVNSDISVDSIEKPPMDSRLFERDQQLWLDQLKSRDAKIVQVIFPRTANNDKELSVYRGEYLQVLDDTRKWWKARNSRGHVAHVPHTIVTLLDYEDTLSRSTDGSGSGDRPPVLRSQPIPPPPPPAPMPAPVPPPAPVIPVMPVMPPIPRQGKKVIIPPRDIDDILIADKRTPKTPRELDPEHAEQLHKELKETISRHRKPSFVSKPRLPPIQLTETSTAKDVQMFLISKNFSEAVQTILKDMNGLGMFKLTQAQLEKYCGSKEEGTRLFGQLVLQKNFCGYMTTRGKELENILKKRRLKVDRAVGLDEEAKGSTSSAISFVNTPTSEADYSVFSDDSGSSDDVNRRHYSEELHSYNRMQSASKNPPPPPPPPPAH